jgi:hypothetical protein
VNRNDVQASGHHVVGQNRGADDERSLRHDVQSEIHRDRRTRGVNQTAGRDDARVGRIHLDASNRVVGRTRNDDDRIHRHDVRSGTRQDRSGRGANQTVGRDDACVDRIHGGALNHVVRRTRNGDDHILRHDVQSEVRHDRSGRDVNQIVDRDDGLVGRIRGSASNRVVGRTRYDDGRIRRHGVQSGIHRGRSGRGVNRTVVRDGGLVGQNSDVDDLGDRSVRGRQNQVVHHRNLVRHVQGGDDQDLDPSQVVRDLARHDELVVRHRDVLDPSLRRVGLLPGPDAGHGILVMLLDGHDLSRVLRLGHFVLVVVADQLQVGRLVDRDRGRRHGRVLVVGHPLGNDLDCGGECRLLVAILGVRRLDLVLVGRSRLVRILDSRRGPESRLIRVQSSRIGWQTRDCLIPVPIRGRSLAGQTPWRLQCSGLCGAYNTPELLKERYLCSSTGVSSYQNGHESDGETAALP